VHHHRTVEALRQHRLVVGDLTIYLDAYIDRVPAAPPVGMTVADVARADFVLVGHSHFDHLYGAERIAKRTGAKILGSHETVRIMEAHGVPLDRMMPVSGGERVRLSDDVTVDVYPSQHSCVWSHGQMPRADEVCIGDLGVSLQEQKERMAELGGGMQNAIGPDGLAHLLGSMTGHSNRGDGGALIYLFELPEGTLLYQDTSGHWTGIVDGLHADVAIVAAAGRANIDGEPIQGRLADFVADHVARIAPKRALLSHHDNWLPGFSVDTDVAPIHAAIKERAPDVEILTLDYVDGTTIL